MDATRPTTTTFALVRIDDDFERRTPAIGSFAPSEVEKFSGAFREATVQSSEEPHPAVQRLVTTRGTAWRIFVCPA